MLKTKLSTILALAGILWLVLAAGASELIPAMD